MFARVHGTSNAGKLAARQCRAELNAQPPKAAAHSTKAEIAATILGDAGVDPRAALALAKAKAGRS